MTFAVYGPAGEGQLLFVTEGREDQPPNAWLFRTRKNAPANGESGWATHQGPILYAAFSPRGDRLVTAGADNQAKLWDTGSDVGKPAEIVKPLNHDARVFFAQFSPAGDYVATASRDRRAQVWDANTGRPAHPPLHHSGTVDFACFTSNGRHLVTMSRGAAYRWDLTRAGSRPLLLRQPDGARIVARASDGRAVVAAGDWHSDDRHGLSKGWAQVWETATGESRTGILRHPEKVMQTAISPANGGLVSTVTVDGVIRIWDVEGGRPRSPELGENASGAVYTAFGHANGQALLLAVTREDRKRPLGRSRVRVWSVGASGGFESLGAFDFHAPFTAATFSPDGKQVAAYCGDGERPIAVVWKIGDKEPKALLRNDQGAAVGWEVVPRREITRSEIGWTKVAGDRKLQLQDTHSEAITSVTFNQRGDRLVTTSMDDTAVVWDLLQGQGTELNGRESPLVEGHTADVLYAAFDQSGDRIVTAGADRQAIVWGFQSARWKPLAVLELGAKPRQVMFTPDERGSYVLTSCDDRTTRLWDARDGRAIAVKRHSGEVVEISCQTSGSGGYEVLVVGLASSEARPARPQGARDGRAIPAKDHGGEVPDDSRQANESGSLTVDRWPLNPLKAPNQDELLGFAELIACRRIAPQGYFLRQFPLTTHEVHARWQRSTAEKSGGSSEGLAWEAIWHVREAGWSELRVRGRSPAAQWHLSQAAAAFSQVMQAQGDKDSKLALSRAKVLIRLKDWHKAAEALEGVVKSAPQDELPLRLQLAAVYLQPAGKERWGEAIRALEECKKRFPDDYRSWVHLAYVQIAKDESGPDYPATRRETLKRFKGSDGEIANRVAWAACLAAHQDDPEAPVALAKKAASTSPKLADYTNTLGAALHRAGRHADAEKEIQAAQQQRGKDFVPADQVPYADAFDLLLLAMTKSSSGAADEAAMNFDLAIQKINKLNADKATERPETSIAYVWRRLQLEVLRREVEGMIKKK